MNAKYKILHLEDVFTDAQLVARELKINNVEFEHLVIDNREQYIEALENFSPDIILCDHSLPSFNSIEAIKIVKAKKLDVPFILITATMTEEVAMNVVNKGADDYILKDRLKRLPSAVINAIEKYRFEKERKKYIDDAQEKEALSKKQLVSLSNKLLLATRVAGVGIWEYCIDEEKFIVDEVVLTMYGTDATAFNNSYENWINFIHSADRNRVEAAFQDCLIKSSGFDTEFRIVWHDTTIRYVKATAQIQERFGEKSACLVGTLQDITKSKIDEEKLRENQEQLLESQKIAHTGSWQVNFLNSEEVDVNSFRCSEETYRIFGINEERSRMLIDLFYQYVHPEHFAEVVSSLCKPISDKLPYSINFRIVRTDGSVRWVHQQAKMVVDPISNAPVKMFGTIKDITESKEQEIQLQKNAKEREVLISELTKSISDLKLFSYITSHNFRAPLSNLIGFLNLINEDDLTEMNKQIIGMFKTSTLQLNETINDLATLLVIRNNKNVALEANDIEKVVKKVLGSLKEELSKTPHTVNIEILAPSILSNKSYLESIVTNLLSNAIKYSSPNRPLRIDISTSYNEFREVQMIIKDNGLGIDLSSHSENIFGLYQRFHTDINSVGLGLYIVKSQILALGGDIKVESEVNKGSSFLLTFKSDDKQPVQPLPAEFSKSFSE